PDKQTINQFEVTGAGWVRPHVGPAVWGLVQNKKKADYDWTMMDEYVEDFQGAGLNILVTVWPFANWDQKNRTNANNCKVKADDQFLPQPYEDDMPYLPQYRCNPNNWKKYNKWVRALVERYDGDGIDDMPDLAYGIKYWEILNEPDLAEPVQQGKEDKDDEEEESLDFYQQGYKAYYKLLRKTNRAIKKADPEAKTLIAGAAGGGTGFLNFYENIFSKYKKAKKHFDIGNVHCISNDYYNNYNVKAYKRLLNKYKIRKNIWVTEAEAMVHETREKNYTQTRKSTKKALNAGAKKIFYTRMVFGDKGYTSKWSKKKYKKIIDKFN
ncbi:MAG: hypothetical protein ABID45_00465, partial [Patescibacteria group bacterium]